MNTQIRSLILARLGIALITLIIVSFIVFAATEMLPGDIAQILLGQAATPEAVAGLREAMGLNDPAFLRFLRWMGGLLQGDLGKSYANNMPVADLIGGRLMNTLQLAAVTAIFSVPVALFLGITTAMYQGSVYDRAVNFLVIGVISVPEFLVATLAVLVFLGAWNDFMWPLIVLSDRDLQTLPVALAGLSREHVQDTELMMAGSVLTVMPVLLLFLVLQKHYMKGLLMGSVK
jgi:ABC-type dipeptide/oligopeptide/nickel transport system permease component